MSSVYPQTLDEMLPTIICVSYVNECSVLRYVYDLTFLHSHSPQLTNKVLA